MGCGLFKAEVIGVVMEIKHPNGPRPLQRSLAATAVQCTTHNALKPHGTGTGRALGHKLKGSGVAFIRGAINISHLEPLGGGKQI